MQKKILMILGTLVLFSLPFAVSYYQRILYRPYLTVVGFANMSDGIGRQSVEIINAMKDSVSVGFYPTKSSNLLDVPPSVQKIMSRKRAQMGKVVLYEDIFSSCSHAFFKKRFHLDKQDELRIAYSMFESSQLPELWVHNLNRYFDAVAVPDPFLVEVYQHSGVTIPVFVLPLGLNLEPFLKEPLKTAPHTPFVFANFSTCISRKNHHTLVQAFHQAFKDDPSVLLWINSKYTEENLFQQLQKEVSALDVSNILLTSNCYDHKEYLNNFQAIDCYISISQSEGFSIQPREAMALGIPCILSDNSAQTTICHSGLVSIVAAPHQELAYYEPVQDVFGYRHDIDFGTCVEALQTMYENYQDYLAKGAEMRKWAARYDYQALSPLYKLLLKPKKVVLGTGNRLEGDTLITNSSKLYHKYKAIL